MRSSSFVRAVSILVLTALVLGGTSAAFAQRRNNGTYLKGKGELMDFRPGFLQVKDKEENVWILKVEAKPEDIVVEGTAEASWLQPGMFVRFTAQLSKKGQAEAPIEKLTVYTPRPDYVTGVIEEPNEGAPFVFGEEPAAEKKKTPNASSYLVAGQLVRVNGNEILVNANGPRVTATIAAEPEIDVELLGDYSMVRKGDTVSFKGRAFQLGQAVVDKVEVKATEPFKAAEQPEPPAKKKRSRRRRNETPEPSTTESAE
ncbi:MAG: hypothetical protein KDA60_15750 [Planctomycetales bacterium]|nr:hypothetical protein [Planctomycetales bacterium]